MKTHHTHLPSLSKLCLLCLSILLLPTLSHARDEAFSWIANPEPVTGYKLFYNIGEINDGTYDGTGLNEGSSPILTGKVTEFTVTGMSPNETYHFTITAYDGTEESGYSAIVSFDPLPFPSPIINTMSQN